MGQSTEYSDSSGAPGAGKCFSVSPATDRIAPRTGSYRTRWAQPSGFGGPMPNGHGGWTLTLLRVLRREGAEETGNSALAQVDAAAC